MEEIAFRGYVLDTTLGPLPDWGAIVASAMLLSLYHVSRSQLLPPFLLEMGLAFLMMKSHTMWIPLIAHAGYNLIGLIVALATSSS